MIKILNDKQFLISFSDFLHIHGNTFFIIKLINPRNYNVYYIINSSTIGIKNVVENIRIRDCINNLF